MSQITLPRLHPMAAILAVIMSVSWLSPTVLAQETGADVMSSPSPAPAVEPSGIPAGSAAPSETREDVTAPSPLIVTVEAGDLWFSPNVVSIEAGQGQGAVLALTGLGLTAHNLIIDELGLQLYVGPGITSEVDVSELPAGTYQFYCSIYGHARAGMVGTLTITSPLATPSPEPAALSGGLPQPGPKSTGWTTHANIARES
jgi:plastocyanin